MTSNRSKTRNRTKGQAIPHGIESCWVGSALLCSSRKANLVVDVVVSHASGSCWMVSFLGRVCVRADYQDSILVFF